jgi:O-antigen/teichoic acid export membrane protein
MNSENRTSLRVTTVRALKWTSLEVFLRQGLQLLVAIILARLLGPDDFGTIATIYIFTSIATAFMDGGLSTSLIQNQKITIVDESTVFWFNLGIGGLMSLVLWFIARPISEFYVLPILLPLTKVLAFNVFLSSVGAIHNTILIKQLRSQVLMTVGIFSTMASGVIAIVMAWEGFGVWALAAQTISATTISAIMLWSLSKWRPYFVFSLKSAKKLLGFGSYMLAATLLDNLYGRLCLLMIGKLYGVRELGLYNRAESTSGLTSQFLSPIISRIALSTFSIAAYDKVQLRNQMQYAIRGSMLLNIPAMLGMAAIAEPLIYVLFGEKWIGATLVTQVLCFAGLLSPLHQLNLNVLMAQGHSKLFFWLDVVKKIIGITLLLIGSKFGVMGVAWSLLISGFIAYLINTFYTKKFIDYGAFSQIRDFLPVLIISLIMSLIVYCINIKLNIYIPIKLILLIVIGALIFSTLALVFKIVSVRDLYKLISLNNNSEKFL